MWLGIIPTSFPPLSPFHIHLTTPCWCFCFFTGHPHTWKQLEIQSVSYPYVQERVEIPKKQGMHIYSPNFLSLPLMLNMLTLEVQFLNSPIILHLEERLIDLRKNNRRLTKSSLRFIYDFKKSTTKKIMVFEKLLIIVKQYVDSRLYLILL